VVHVKNYQIKAKNRSCVEIFFKAIKCNRPTFLSPS